MPLLHGTYSVLLGRPDLGPVAIEKYYKRLVPLGFFDDDGERLGIVSTLQVLPPRNTVVSEMLVVTSESIRSCTVTRFGLGRRSTWRCSMPTIPWQTNSTETLPVHTQ